MKLYTKRNKLNLLFKPSYLNSNFLLTLGYLNPPLNNPALKSTTTGFTVSVTASQIRNTVINRASFEYLSSTMLTKLP